MGQDSITKVYNKIKLNGLTEDIVSSSENSENLLVKTNNGEIPTDNIKICI